MIVAMYRLNCCCVVNVRYLDHLARHAAFDIAPEVVSGAVSAQCGALGSIPATHSTVRSGIILANAQQF